RFQLALDSHPKCRTLRIIPHLLSSAANCFPGANFLRTDRTSFCVCFERRPLSCAAVLENSLTILPIHFHMLTGLPPQRCVAVPATAADSSWPETACSLKLSPLSAAFRQFPRDEILLLRRAEKRRVDAASVMPLPAPRPSARTDARLAPAAP